MQGIAGFVWTEGGYPAPVELVYALMCREFHCTPSELRKEPADLLFQTFMILNKYDTWVSKKGNKNNKGSMPVELMGRE